MRTRLRTALLLALVATSTPAAAQGDPDAPPAKQPAEAAPAKQPPRESEEPDEARDRAPRAPGPRSDDAPQLPEVKDAMLQPVSPAKRVLTSWRQGIQLVRKRSTARRQALARVEQARGQARQALAGALPRVSGRGSINHHLIRGRGIQFSAASGPRLTNIPDPATQWSAGLNVTQPLFAPTAWFDHGTAKASARAAKLSAKETERQLLGTLADTIVGVITAERLAEVSRVSLKSSLTTLDLTRRRARLGAASAVDVLRAEQEVTLTRGQVVTTNESVRRAREALGLALGYSDPWGVRPDIKLDELARDARGTCRRERNVDTRPDVVAARAQMRVARRARDRVDKSYLPTVDLVSDLTYFAVDQFTANGEHVTWTIGGVLTWVIYDGGARAGQGAVSKADLITARESLTQTRRSARIEVRQTERAVKVAKANLAVSVRSRQIASQSARLARIAFVNGSGTSFDLVDAARRLREAELDLAVKEFDLVSAQIASFLALATCDV